MLTKGSRDKEFWGIISLTWVIHLAIFTYMLLAYLLGTDKWRRGFRLIENSLVHWDADNYLNIAKVGYEVDWQMVFFPLYPFLVTFLTYFLRNLFTSALLINFVCHLVGTYYLYRLISMDEEAEVARDAVLFSLIFPTAFYAVIPYTESLFLMLAICSLTCFRKKIFYWAGILAFLCTLSRPTGVAVIPMLAAEYWFSMRKTIPWKKILFPILFPGLGIVFYLTLNYAYYGDVFHFFRQEHAVWDKHITWPHVGFLKSWHQFFGNRKFSAVLNNFNELFGGILIWVTMIYAVLKLRKSYAAFCIASCFATTCVSSWMSTLRFSFAIFPMYIMMARCSKEPINRHILISFSLVYMAILAGHFARGQWVQ